MRYQARQVGGTIHLSITVYLPYYTPTPIPLRLSSSSSNAKTYHSSGILKDAEYIYSNAIDVSIDMYGTKAAAASIYSNMQEREYSARTWNEHELHPKLGEDLEVVELVNFVFTMDLLNFSFVDQCYIVNADGFALTGLWLQVLV